MIFIKPHYEIIPQIDDILGAYEQSEIGARTCYKSENAIKYDEDGRSLTAKSFVEKLMNVNKHGSIAEHGAVYLSIRENYTIINPKHWDIKTLSKQIKKYCENKFSWVNYKDGVFYITTNLRVINENNWWNDLEDPNVTIGYTTNHEKRVTIRFKTQIAISREANRHRVHSPSEQSTRYCSYVKDKFGNEVNINIPEFVKDDDKLKQYENTSNKEAWLKNYCRHIICNDYESVDNQFSIVDYWLFGNLAAEFAYKGMIRLGAKPEQARTVLPLDTNTELVHTAYVYDWIQFIKLRIAPNAHPDIRVLASEMKKDFIENGWATEKDFED